MHFQLGIITTAILVTVVCAQKQLDYQNAIYNPQTYDGFELINALLREAAHAFNAHKYGDRLTDPTFIIGHSKSPHIPPRDPSAIYSGIPQRDPYEYPSVDRSRPGLNYGPYRHSPARGNGVVDKNDEVEGPYFSGGPYNYGKVFRGGVANDPYHNTPTHGISNHARITSHPPPKFNHDEFVDYYDPVDNYDNPANDYFTHEGKYVHGRKGAHSHYKHNSPEGNEKKTGQSTNKKEGSNFSGGSDYNDISDADKMDNPVNDKEDPVKEEPAEDDPINEDPIKEDPTKEEPEKEEPTKEELAKEEPIKEEPTKEEPTEKEPVEEKSTEENPVEKKPTKEEGPVIKVPVVENPVDENPIEEPVEEDPLGVKPVEKRSG